MSSNNFAILGAAGYIAPRHMQAIKDTGNQLIAAMDPHDSVGILDRYFYDVDFFTEFERFDRHVEKLRRLGPDKAVHYVSICSPNYLHDAHIRLALRINADAICEKPLVLNPWNLDALAELEQETQRRIYTVLQLRTHPSIVQLREKIANDKSDTVYDIDLAYITSRGKWYHFSWKGDQAKSGGIPTNIGIHFFDMLIWIFGKPTGVTVEYSDYSKIKGTLELQRARVNWFLSIDGQDLPVHVKEKGQPTFRSIMMNGEEIEFSTGFTDLHTIVYKDILSGKGYGIEDAFPSIQLVRDIRNSKAERQKFHPWHAFVHK
jgi:UDP-N-acetyl-2-amino-2-deoxyglucuronate dehydrogenase